MTVSSAVALILHVPWTYVFLNSTHIFIGSAKTSIGTITYFLGILYMFMLSNQFLILYIQSKHKDKTFKCVGYGVYTPESTLQDTLIHYAKA